jgi:hypothetical protein
MASSSEAQEWNARQARANEYYATEGRALRDIERELREIRLLLAAVAKHFGVRA